MQGKNESAGYGVMQSGNGHEDSVRLKSSDEEERYRIWDLLLCACAERGLCLAGRATTAIAASASFGGQSFRYTQGRPRDFDVVAANGNDGSPDNALADDYARVPGGEPVSN